MIDIPTNYVVFAMIAASVTILACVMIFRNKIATRRAKKLMTKNPIFKAADRDIIVRMYIKTTFNSAIVAIATATIIINTLYLKLSGQALFIKNSNIVLGVVIGASVFLVLRDYYLGVRAAIAEGRKG